MIVKKMSKVLCILLISGLIFTGCDNTSQENEETSDVQATDTVTRNYRIIPGDCLTYV